MSLTFLLIYYYFFFNLLSTKIPHQFEFAMNNKKFYITMKNFQKLGHRIDLSVYGFIGLHLSVNRMIDKKN